MIGEYISFVGTDGSGKTTTAKATIEILRKEGHKVHYEYGGRIKFRVLKFMNKVSKKSFDKKIKKGQNPHAVEYKSPLLKLIAPFVYYLEYLLIYLTSTIWKLLKNDYFISDRGFIDIIITPNTNSKVAVFLYYLLPRPKLIYLYNTPEIICKRRDDHPEEDLKRQLKEYNKYSRFYKAKIKSDKIEDVIKEVRRYI